jgi:pyruvate dehydrogenase E2 component (dihydrolipoamide acetyltransferase)
MATPILLPRQGQSVESCILTEFYVSIGDIVTIGTTLFAYETDKAAFEEEAKADGTILALFFEEGDEVPVLTNVGVIGEEGESVEEFAPGGKGAAGIAAAAEEQAEAVRPAKEDSLESIKEKTLTKVSSEAVTISPRAKKLAKKESVEYDSISGSGPNGRIIETDILQYLETRPRITPLAKKIMKEQGLVARETKESVRQRVTSQDLMPAKVVYASDSEEVPLTNIRKLIAGAMHRSLQNSAQLTHHLSADARRILELRQKVKAAQNEGYAYNLTLNDMICMAVVKTLKAFPRANSHFLGESLRVFNKVHLGLAVDTERGLMVPAIKNADDLSIQGLSSQMKAVAESCRVGNVDPDLLSPEAATFTVSNLGNYGVEMFTPVINLPQVAILGVNTILPRPKDLGNGVYGFVPHLGLSLTYDHQALDGGEATRFLKAIATAVENLEIEL